jgi:hypothetical protein
MSNDGASMNVSDPLLSRLIGWGGSIAAVIIGSGILWVGAQLVGIKESLASMAATQRASAEAIVAQLNKNDLRDDLQDGRINQLDREVATINGRNLRGHQEASRGR